MTLDELETFICIARGGTATEASRRLGRSQPAVTRRIQQLEGTLDTALFERSGRRLVLTAAGHALLPHAEAALAAVRDGRSAVEALRRGGGKQRLRLAIVGTLADSHLVEALRRFETHSPETTVDVTTATSREVSALVRSGEANLGLRYFADADPGLTSTPIGEERLELVVPANHPVKRKRLRSLAAFSEDRWLGFPPERGQPQSLGRLLEQTLAAAGIAPSTVTIVDSLTAQKRLVEAGLGVTLMQRSAVREELALGSLRAIELQGFGLAQPIVAIRRKGAYESPIADNFLTGLLRAMPRRSTR